MARGLERFSCNLIHNEETDFIQDCQTQDNIQQSLQIINYIQIINGSSNGN